MAVLGGLDVLVFTAGIGEHNPVIRKKICEGLEGLGVKIDDTRNASNAVAISTEDSAIRVQVLPTNEELMIARHVANVIEQ